MERNITISSYFCPSDIGNYHDSMELDSGQELLCINATCSDLQIEAVVQVTGSVRVIFRDQVFKKSSDMPQELLECYHNGTDPEAVALSDGKEYETPYYCDENNWLEEFIIVRDSKGNIVNDTFSEVIDFIDDNTSEGWKKYLIDDIKKVLDEVLD